MTPSSTVVKKLKFQIYLMSPFKLTSSIFFGSLKTSRPGKVKIIFDGCEKPNISNVELRLHVKQPSVVMALDGNSLPDYQDRIFFPILETNTVSSIY